MAEKKRKLLKFSKLDFSKITFPKLSFKETPMNGFLVIALVIFAFLLGMLTNKVIYLEKQLNNPAQALPAGQAAAAPPVPTITEDTIKNLFTDNNLVLGDPNSKNLIVEIADPSCPYCHAAGGHNPELNKEMGPQFTMEADGGTYIAPLPKIKELVDQGKAAFVWIYYPGHGTGEMGTKALYCADEQGRFWEVHDKLMTNAGYDLLNIDVQNDQTKAQQLVDFLADAADPGQLKSCIESGKYDEKLAADIETANSLGVGGTPGFFINTAPFLGAYSWKEMESAIK